VIFLSGVGMWFTIVKLYYEAALFSLAVVKSQRKFKPPYYIESLWKPRKSSEVVRLSDLGVVIKGEGRRYIEQYIGKWMRKREFLRVMESALYRSYKSVRTVERMMSALREFVEKPIEPRLGLRRPQNAIYELPARYPSVFVATRAERKVWLDKLAVFVFSKTIHVVPYDYEVDVTVVVPRGGNISDIRLTENGLRVLKELDEELKTAWINKRDREVLEELKPAIALARLLS
jgi:hypothetical protein